jgi:hypothetical protein
LTNLSLNYTQELRVEPVPVLTLPGAHDLETVTFYNPDDPAQAT